MNIRAILYSSVLLSGFWISIAQASSFIEEPQCPPNVWCATGASDTSLMAGAAEAATAVGEALEDPEDCVGDCAFGKIMVDLITDLYPDCYPNCNITEPDGPASSAPANPPEDNPPAETPPAETPPAETPPADSPGPGESVSVQSAKFPSKGFIRELKMDRKTSGFLKSFPNMQTKRSPSKFDQRYLKGGRAVVVGKFLSNPRKGNKYRVFAVHIYGKRGGIYDRVYIAFDKKRAFMFNHAQAKRIVRRK
jgi:hypothetical protein